MVIWVTVRACAVLICLERGLNVAEDMQWVGRTSMSVALSMQYAIARGGLHEACLTLGAISMLHVYATCG